jgi:WD40 repeat protein
MAVHPASAKVAQNIFKGVMMKKIRTRRKNLVLGCLVVLIVLAGAWLIFGGRSLVKHTQWQAEASPSPWHSDTPLALSPDGKILARGGDPVRLYDTASGRLLLVLPTPNDSSIVRSLALSPKGDVVACARTSAPRKEPIVTSTEIFDAKTGARLADLDVAAASFAFSPDGTMLVTSSPKVEFWSVPAFKPLAAFPPPGIFGGDLAFSPDGKLLAIAQYTQVEIFDVKTLTSVAALPGPAVGTTSFFKVAFGSDGNTVIAAADRRNPPTKTSGVWAWDLASKKLKWHKDFGESMAQASMSADGQTLAIMLSGYEFLSPRAWIEVWDLHNHSKIGSQKGGRFFLCTFALSGDGTRLAMEFDPHMPRDPATIEIWKVE